MSGELRQLDAEIAEKVMQLPQVERHGDEICFGRQGLNKVAHYSTDISAAMQVADRMFRFPENVHDSFLRLLMRNCPQSNVEPWQIMGYVLSISNKPEWICRAALKAISENTVPTPEQVERER